MKSLYDDLTEKLARDPRLTKRGGPRVELSLLLFNHRESLHDIWVAAERCVRTGGGEGMDDLRAAVDKLHPIFGERNMR